MDKTLKPGMSAETDYIVEKRHLALEVGSGLVAVYSTAMMIGGMEAAAVKAVQDYLPANCTTVGVHVDVAHKAATPIGMRVRFQATLTEISPNGKGYTFKVQAWDETCLIGEGLHKRVLVEKEKFEQKTRAKLNGDSKRQSAT